MRTAYRASLALALWSALSAHALLVDWNSLDFVFGSGGNRSAIVVDWNDGNSPDYLSWGFYWDTAPGSGSVADLLQALAVVDPRLDFFFTDFGPLGLFVDGIGFDGNLDSDYDDPGDHYQDRLGGWSQTFVYWLGAFNDPAWSLSGSGISSTSVQNEYVYGFAWNNSGGWPGNPPPVVPEPALPTLLGVGMAAVALCGRRRNRTMSASPC